MDDYTVGRSIRAVRVRRGWRQVDIAALAGVSQQTVSRIERGELEGVALSTLRRVSRALGMRLLVEARWQGADLDRLLGARHSAMHEQLARLFESLPGWSAVPEVSFAVRGERGIIDVLAWHSASRTLLVIELKTELVDVQATVGTVDRKARLAAVVGPRRGWAPARVSRWLMVAESATNSRRVAAHRAMLRAAFPADGRSMPGWLLDPRSAVAGLSFLSPTRGRSAADRLAPVKRVLRRRSNGAAGRC